MIVGIVRAREPVIRLTIRDYRGREQEIEGYVMTRRYFELRDDVDIPGRWHLNGLFDGSGRELDSRHFTYGSPVDIKPPMRVPSFRDGTIIEALPPLQVPPKRLGIPLDFTFASFDLPVVTERIATMLATIADQDIQRLPVVLASPEQNYEIVNVVSRIPCIDAARSDIMWWTEADGRPDKVGKPRMITKFVIDRGQVPGCHIFRPEGWELVIIVSELVKNALEQGDVSGVTFHEV